MNKDIQQSNGACHCGSVRFRVTLPEGLHGARRCNCSFCAMRGAVAVTGLEPEILEGAEMLALYQFNTATAEHHFCRRCGIYTHHRRRSNPAEFGINVACLEGIGPFDFAEVPVNEGRSHPSDRKTGEAVSEVAGVLLFVPAR